MTLTNLEKVSASLGAKAVLWELFNFNPPSLRLYVELCATSQFLTEILINNPGMIDDLVDSLVVDRPLPGAAIKAELAELCKSAEDLAPILSSFRNKEWVRIGTRDILGREPIREVTRELADVAEAIVTQAARDQWQQASGPVRNARLRRDRPPRPLGDPRARQVRRPRAQLSQRSRPGLSPRGRRPDGRRPGRRSPTSNSSPRSRSDWSRPWEAVQHSGTLYTVDARLRPHGTSGPLVLTLDAFQDYLERSTPDRGSGMAFTRARVIFATGGFGRSVIEAIHQVLAVPVTPSSWRRQSVQCAASSKPRAAATT